MFIIWHVGSSDGCHGAAAGDAVAVDDAAVVAGDDGAAAVGVGDDAGFDYYYDAEPDVVGYEVDYGAGCGVLDADSDVVPDVDSDAVDVDWYG